MPDLDRAALRAVCLELLPTYDRERIRGYTPGASADSDELWQIGVDVEPAARRFSIPNVNAPASASPSSWCRPTRSRVSANGFVRTSSQQHHAGGFVPLDVSDAGPRPEPPPGAAGRHLYRIRSSLRVRVAPSVSRRHR